jgi:hypothetical protein
MRRSSVQPTKPFALRSANIVTLDFETYYDDEYSLSKKHNTSEYVRDPLFLVHCVGIKIGKRKTRWYKGRDIKAAIKDIDWGNFALLGQNTAFDGLILAEHYNAVPAYYLDTMSMAKGLHGVCLKHNLDALSKAYGRGGKIQGSLAKTKGLRVLSDEIMDLLGTYCVGDVDETRAIFDMMWPNYPQAELDLIDLTIRMFCDSPLQVDVPLAQSLVEKEQHEKQTLIERTGVDPKNLSSNPKFAEELIRLGVEPPVKISLKTGLENFAFAQNDPEFEALLDHDDHRVVELVEARLAVKSTINETRAARFVAAGETGGLPVALNYFGAHTGRWSGGNKLNLQNMGRAQYDENNEYIPLSDGLRRSVIAPKGYVLVVADSAQIEARVNAWLADHSSMLDIMSAYDKGEGPDIYCVAAEQIYGRPINKKVDKLERHVGKACVLGLGYQMGAAKFQSSLIRGNPSVELPLNMCRDVVNIYRRVNKPIVDQWAFFQNWLVKMCQWRPGQVLEGEYGPGGIVKWRHNGCASLIFPDGLGIHYPDLRQHFDENGRSQGFSYSVNNGRKYTYGGSLDENTIQRIARSIIAHQKLDISRRWRVVLSTHDEIVCCVPVRQADKCLTDMIETMKTPPSWALGLPLNAEGGYDVCYSK